jgi:hypothetical protein
VLLEDLALTVMNEHNPLEPYNMSFEAGDEFDLVARPKGCRVVILRHGSHLICTDRERLAESFEEVWNGTCRIKEGSE